MSRIFTASVRGQADPRRNSSLMINHLSVSPPRKDAGMSESKGTTLSKTPLEAKSSYLADKQKSLLSSVQEVSVRKVPCEIMDRIVEDVPLDGRRKMSADEWTPNNRSQELLLVLDGAHFESQSDKESYRAFKKTHMDSMRQVSFRQEIMPKNPSAWLNSFASKSTWTHREVEWTRAECRLLFATEREEACDNWIFVLNWLIGRVPPPKA